MNDETGGREEAYVPQNHIQQQQQRYQGAQGGRQWEKELSGRERRMRGWARGRARTARSACSEVTITDGAEPTEGARPSEGIESEESFTSTYSSLEPKSN